MAKFGKFMSGFFLGALLGGAAAILLAPYSGDQMRSEVDGYFKKTTEDIRLAAAKKREELEKQLSQLREPQKETPEPEEE